jgi:hypothetical protein
MHWDWGVLLEDAHSFILFIGMLEAVGVPMVCFELSIIIYLTMVFARRCDNIGCTSLKAPDSTYCHTDVDLHWATMASISANSNANGLNG